MAVTMLFKRFTEMCEELYVLVGNHDYINNSQYLSGNHWMTVFKGWENVKVVDKKQPSCVTIGS